MKLFITTSFKDGKNKSEIECLCNLAREAGFEDFCFIKDIENYQKMFDDSKKLMERSKKEISDCDALLIDLTNKPTGRAMEAGIAFAMNKKIIIIMKRGTKIKDTSRGIADIIIEYDHIEDIVPKLKEFLSEEKINKKQI